VRSSTSLEHDALDSGTEHESDEPLDKGIAVEAFGRITASSDVLEGKAEAVALIHGRRVEIRSPGVHRSSGEQRVATLVVFLDRHLVVKTVLLIAGELPAALEIEDLAWAALEAIAHIGGVVP